MKKHLNHQLSSFIRLPKENGFTLIEILVTIIIIGVIGTIATQSLFSLLRGASKVEIIKELKQSGDYVINTLSVDIRNAKDVAVVGSACNDSATVVDDSGCEAAGTSGQCLRITNIDGSNTYYGCDADLANNNINRFRKGDGTNNDYLTNPAVKIDSCMVFTCTNSNSGQVSKVVDINFTLDQAQALVNIAESATQIFDTQVVLRNK